MKQTAKLSSKQNSAFKAIRQYVGQRSKNEEKKAETNKPSSPFEGNSSIQMISNFFENTGISLLSYIGTRSSIVWKLIWLAVIISGVTMTVIQSNDAIQDYFGYAITIRTAFELNGTMQYPAVTLCSNNPINWEYERSTNSSIYQEVVAKLSNEEFKGQYDKLSRKSRTYEQYVLLDVLSTHKSQNEDQHSQYTYGILQKLYWNGETYTNKKSTQSKYLKVLEDSGVIYQFKDFYYGDCVIFNAAIDSSKTERAAALTGAEFTLQWNVNERYPYNNDLSAVVVVHPAGTPPILDDSNNIKVNPGDDVSIAIQQREITRLPPPFPSHCVDRTTDMLKKNSVYYQEDRPYLFSMEACIKTCMQRISIQSCRCWDPQIPLGLLQKNSYTAVLCMTDRCGAIDKQLTSEFCRCKLPCRETLLESTITVKYGLLSDIAKKAANDTDTEYLDGTAQHQLQRASKVKVFIKSAVYESIKEEPKYTVADFWGIIGGNAGLWIGLSAVSLFEIIELLFFLIKSKVESILLKRKIVNVVKDKVTNIPTRRRANRKRPPSSQIKTRETGSNRHYVFLPQ